MIALFRIGIGAGKSGRTNGRLEAPVVTVIRLCDGGRSLIADGFCLNVSKDPRSDLIMGNGMW